MRPIATVAAIVMIMTVPGCAKSTVSEAQRRSALMTCVESLPPGLQTTRGWSAALDTCDRVAQAKVPGN